MIFWRKPIIGPIAIDLGGSSVRMLQLADGPQQPTVVAWAELPLSAGDAAASASLSSAIREAVEQHGFRGRRVVTALGPGEYQLKNIRIPPMPPEDLAAAVAFEATERFGLPPERAQYRHLVAGQVRQGADIREEVMVFAAQREQIDARASLLRAAGLEPMAIDVGPCAMARCFVRFLRRAEDAAAVNVFLDVGARGTSLVVTRGTDVSFVKLFEVGGMQLNRAVADRLGLSDTDARLLRMRLIRAATARKTDARPDDLPAALAQSAADAVRPVLEQLAREVQLSLRYFTITFRGQRLDCVTFVGGEAHEPLLASTMGEGLDLSCTIGYPLRGLGGIGGMLTPERRSHQPAWAVAVGLALTGSRWVCAPGTAAPSAAPRAERREEAAV